MNKILMYIMSLLISTNLCAKNIYISPSGSDANTGLSTLSPWKTIAKLNASMATVVAGDFILFQAGGTWAEGIVMGKSGSALLPITIGSYGTGAKPIITGFKTITGWINILPGIYEAPAAANSRLNMVTLNGSAKAVGRYPNSDAANGGYLKYTSFTGNTAVLAAGISLDNWVGGEMVAKKDGYVLERNLITSQVGDQVGYVRTTPINPRQGGNPQPLIPGGVGFGVFIQRHPNTLDQLGEWYFDLTTRRIRMYFGANNPNSYTIQVSVLDTLINLNTRSGITIDGISLQGANLTAIYYQDDNNIIIQNCDINNTGAIGIFGWNCNVNRVLNNTITNSMSSHMNIVGRSATDLIVRGNRAAYNGTMPGMGSFYDDGDYKGLYISNNNSYIRKNYVDTSGYVGIQFQGNNMYTDSNWVNYYDFVKQDGGGIYTYSTNNTGRFITRNIVMNAVGAPGGDAFPPHAEGIYLDGNAKGVTVEDNGIAYVLGRGLYFNDPRDITARYNTIFRSNTPGWAANKHYADSSYNLLIKRNIFFSPLDGSEARMHVNTGLNSTKPYVAATINESLQLMGDIDSNYYQIPNTNNAFRWFYLKINTGAPTFPPGVNLATWKTMTGHDANSPTVSGTGNFYYNKTDVDLVWRFVGYRKTDVYGTNYDDSVTIAPWQTKILVDNGASPGNTPPTANAGPDQVITLPTSTATLPGSGNDPGGSITGYGWVKNSGPSVTITNANTATASLSNLVEGIYQFSLTVTDNGGAQSSDVVQVTVNPAPVAVTVNAGPDKSMTLPTNSTTLTATTTGIITSYVWSKISGTGGTISPTNTATTTVGSLSAGIYKYRILVNGTVADTVQVTVNPEPIPNVAPVVNAGPDQIITLPTNSATLSGSATDNDGTIVSHGWLKISGPAGGTIASPSNYTTGISALQEGIYEYELSATDDDGAIGRDTVRIIVNPAIPPVNNKPVANAGPDKIITLPTNSIIVNGSGSDTDGVIISYLWIKVNGIGGTIISPSSASTTISGLTEGEYDYRLIVTDNFGDTASDMMHVTVNPLPPNILPTAEAGPNKIIPLPINSTSITASGTDVDGSIVLFGWVKVSGPAGGTLGTPNAATSTVNLLQEGIYKYQVTVTDDRGGTATDSMLITVLAAPIINIPPMSVPGPNRTIVLPTNSLIFNGVGVDLDGTITGYLWTKDSGPAGGDILSPTTGTTTIDNLAFGEYVYSLRVTDNDGATGTRTVKITVYAEPTVNGIIYIKIK